VGAVVAGDEDDRDRARAMQLGGDVETGGEEGRRRAARVRPAPRTSATGTAAVCSASWTVPSADQRTQAYGPTATSAAPNAVSNRRRSRGPEERRRPIWRA